MGARDFRVFCRITAVVAIPEAHTSKKDYQRAQEVKEELAKLKLGRI